MTAKTSHKWAIIFMKGDYEEFSNELLGSKQAGSFYDSFPAIEGLWCNQAAYARSRTDQSFEKIIELIWDSRIHFVKRNIALKLFRRFWRSIEAYSQRQTYADILKLFFSQPCKTSVQSHRRISNKNIDED